MRKFTSICAVLGVILVVYGEPASKILDLEQAIQYAVQNSSLVMAAKAGTDALEAKLMEAEWAAWPHASFRALVTPMARQYGNAVQGGTDLSKWGVFAYTEVTGAWPLFTFGKISNLKRAAQWGVDVGRAREEIARAEVVFRVKRGYEALMLAEAMAEVIEEGREYLEKARKHLEDLEASEDPSYDPVDRMKLRVYETEILQRELQVERGRKVARTMLKVAMGAQPGMDFEFEVRFPSPVELPPDLDLEALVEKAVAGRPELVALRMGIRAKEAEVAMRRAAFWPNLFVAGQFRYGYSNVADPQASPFANDPFNTYSAGGGIGLEMDFEIGRKIAELRLVEAEVRKMAAELRDAENAVRLEVERLFREMLDARRMVTEYEEAVSAARGWVIAKTDLYENDLCGINEVLDGLVQFFKVRMEALQAVHDYNVAVAALERALGEPLMNKR